MIKKMEMKMHFCCKCDKTNFKRGKLRRHIKYASLVFSLNTISLYAHSLRVVDHVVTHITVLSFSMALLCSGNNSQQLQYLRW